MTARDDQRAATYRKIVEVAVESLIETGYAATTTVEVQRRAGLSRGALLHHFPTREQLFTAAVHRLVEANIEAMWAELAAAPPDADPISRGMRVLRRAARHPSFGAELELWGAARSDERLRTALRAAERGALHELRAVIDSIFGPRIAALPRYPIVVDLTIQLMRGLAISESLHDRARDEEPLIDHWAQIVRDLLADDGARARS
jgi:AcrR family transcriptional regulator